MKFKLRYLPLFAEDLYNAASYISHRLDNPDAADRLVNEVEKAILERLEMPLSFEPYRSAKKRADTYYRIYVGNYTVFLCCYRRCNGGQTVYIQRKRFRQIIVI